MLILDQSFWPLSVALDPASAFRGEYDSALVATSIAIAALSAFVALSISERMRAAASPRVRWAWASGGALSMGGGIWAMHFVGMLAFELPCGVGYDPRGTVLSMLPGALASGCALVTISRSTTPSFWRLGVGALLMGGGIGAMHYTGMAAMRPEALLVYDPVLVGVSIVVAAVLAFISLSIRFRFGQPDAAGRLGTVTAALVMGLAISGMHYTAMEAAIFFPDPKAVATGMTLAQGLLATAIAIVAVLVAGIALAATYAARQMELIARLSAEMTRRAAVEHEARDGRARLQAIVDSVADAIVTIDRGGRILQWSSGAQRIFGYRAEEVVGAELIMLMPEPHRSNHHCYVDAFMSTREAKIIGIGRELTAVRKDGTEFDIDLTVTEVRGIDEVLFTGILRDITERKRAQRELVEARHQAEAASKAKSQFLATMSHEIRTPLHGILGMANLLASTTLNDRQGHLVQNLLRSGKALMGGINDILDFSKIEAGHVELLDVDFDLRQLISEVVDLFGERCTSKGLELVYFIDEGVPCSLRGDPERLRQILVNLLGNATKFTERGEILVEMSVPESSSSHVILYVSVLDTGIGIAPQHRAAVFESFHQVDGSMSRSRGGSGLGLAITKQLVQLMGGRIDVESEVGRGSRFWFTARLRKSEAEATAPRGARRLVRPLTALLVDANAVSAHVMLQYLGAWGVDAAVAASIDGIGAKLAGGHEPDVVILDNKDPGSVAADLIAGIPRGRSGRRPEIILLTAIDSLLSDESAANAGAFAILSKPVRPSELFDALASIAAGSQSSHMFQWLSRRSVSDARPRFDARVLVAEDNAVNQDVATAILMSIGCRVITVPNGRAAVEAFARERFDVVLMDCEMPEMDGFEASQRIRESESRAGPRPGTTERAPPVPIIAVTAHALPEMRERCLAAGMNDFVVKPYDESQLAEAIGRWLPAPGSVPPAAAPAASSAVVGEGVLDLTVIEQIRCLETQGRAGLLSGIVRKVIDSAPLKAAEIRAKCRMRDGEALWRAAHDLRSGAGAVGAKRLSARCAEIETAARSSGPAAVDAMLDDLDVDVAAVLAALNSLISDADAHAS